MEKGAFVVLEDAEQQKAAQVFLIDFQKQGNVERGLGLFHESVLKVVVEVEAHHSSLGSRLESY